MQRVRVPLPFGYTSGQIQNEVQLITLACTIAPSMKLSFLLLSGISDDLVFELLTWSLVFYSIKKLRLFSENSFGARSIFSVHDSIQRHPNLLAAAQQHGVTMFRSRAAVHRNFNELVANGSIWVAATTATVIFYMQESAKNGFFYAGFTLAAWSFFELAYSQYNYLGASVLSPNRAPQ